MKLVAIETSTLAGSIAAAQRTGSGWSVVHRVLLPPTVRTAKSLPVALAGLLDELGWRPAKLDAVAAATGPGSFTGLRIGVTAAKTLAYATGAQAVGVNTLAVIARQWFAYPQCDHAPRTHVAMEAHRGEFFATAFDYPPTGDKDPPEVQIIEHTAWAASIPGGDAANGPGVAQVADQLADGVVLAPEQDRPPRADALAKLAGEAFDAGRGVAPWQLMPDYYRLSAAEEKAAANE